MRAVDRILPGREVSGLLGAGRDLASFGPLASLADAVALQERLAGRPTELGDRVNASLVRQEETTQKLVDADEQASTARGLLATAERAQDEAREARAAQQVAHAQAEARRQIATERRERLAR
ncbi:MAG TPA: hypothetical protein PK788_13025, partial [Gemmatimonadaceae bacterium]|nr:hypothetical protein [Gemmatimonadaceae bacterium]